MPPLPTIPDVFRIRLLWTGVSPSRPVNVFHVRTTTGSVSQIAAAVEANFTTTMIRPVSGTFSVTGVGITPLDGTTAEQFFTWASSKAGQSTGDILPSTAAVMSFRSSQRGPQGRGRMFLGPVAESVADGGFWNGTDKGLCVTAWNTFNTAITGSAAACPMVVASYAHVAAYTVLTYNGRAPFGTQRRRQDRLV